jgi:nitrogen-specific signal transduction histidine kinase
MIEHTPLVDDIQNYAQNIVDTVRDPLLILDATLRVRSANRAFCQTFHVSPAETEGRLIYELGNGQWDIPDLRTLLEDIVPKSSVFDDFELDHTFAAIGRRAMLLNARKLQAGHHGELLVLAMGDVTERKRAEAITRWRGSEKPQDDVSILAVEFLATSYLGEPRLEPEVSPLATRSSSLKEFKVAPVAGAGIQLT